VEDALSVIHFVSGEFALGTLQGEGCWKRVFGFWSKLQHVFLTIPQKIRYSDPSNALCRVHSSAPSSYHRSIAFVRRANFEVFGIWILPAIFDCGNLIHLSSR
jgi:hypothetical protein